MPRFIVDETGRGPQPAHDAAVRLYTAVLNGERLSTERITELQRAIGVNGDGVIGNGTRDRIAYYLIASGNPAGSELQRQAAVAASLYAAQRGTSVGTWRNIQLRMGSIAADGVYGDETRARMTNLLRTP